MVLIHLVTLKHDFYDTGMILILEHTICCSCYWLLFDNCILQFTGLSQIKITNKG